MIEHKTSVAYERLPKALLNFADSFKIFIAANGSTTFPEITEADSCFNFNRASPAKDILPSISNFDSNKLNCLANNNHFLFTCVLANFAVIACNI